MPITPFLRNQAFNPEEIEIMAAVAGWRLGTRDTCEADGCDAESEAVRADAGHAFCLVRSAVNTVCQVLPPSVE